MFGIKNGLFDRNVVFEVYLQFSSQIIDSNVELVNLEKAILEFGVMLKLLIGLGPPLL